MPQESNSASIFEGALSFRKFGSLGPNRRPELIPVHPTRSAAERWEF